MICWLLVCSVFQDNFEDAETKKKKHLKNPRKDKLKVHDENLSKCN